ncbi:MAG: AsmA family protein [Deltaproteobacteria bacterium]|nr:AsmA family protein [Deltaproteobacteria bacterium]
MKIAEKIKAMSRLEKSVTAALTSLVIFTVVGFLVLPPILKSILQKKLSENLHRQVVVEDIDLNPYVLSLTVQGFVIKGFETSDTFVSFDELYVNLDIMSLFKWALIAKEIRIERPHINIIRHEETRYNFSDLIQDKGSSSTPSTPLQFSANNIQLLNGSIDILDEPKDKKHKMTTVSNLPHYVDIFVEPLFEAKFNETPVSLKGKTKPFHDTVETIFDIDLKDINVPYYLAYVPLEQNFKVLAFVLSKPWPYGAQQR